MKPHGSSSRGDPRRLRRHLTAPRASTQSCAPRASPFNQPPSRGRLMAERGLEVGSPGRAPVARRPIGAAAPGARRCPCPWAGDLADRQPLDEVQPADLGLALHPNKSFLPRSPMLAMSGFAGSPAGPGPDQVGPFSRWGWVQIQRVPIDSRSPKTTTDLDECCAFYLTDMSGRRHRALKTRCNERSRSWRQAQGGNSPASLRCR